MIVGVGIGELGIGSNNMVVILTTMKTFHVEIALKHEMVFFNLRFLKSFKKNSILTNIGSDEQIFNTLCINLHFISL
jgi:hypothetical protein